ncbi:glycosyltransferase family 2 protein [Flectobacillus major]|jgi:glycosyltransferase involved in cell wall biosynthesis|uniref:glycosyltransferase family 2 protein n=1 Tax=Flectobacillus major TaxID=103 RepID=UPI000405DA46|nr:glycosyltransferase family 2 protein [Flectobacillus major]
MQNFSNISVTILTKNSASRLRQCLDALQGFDEVVILDNGSSDNTLAIAREYTNVQIYEHPFLGFGKMRNMSVSFCKNDWILWVDSDEVLDKALLDTVESLPLNPHQLYRFLRKQYYHGKYINGAGWGNDKVIRLFNKNSTSFNDKDVHEGLITSGLQVVDVLGVIHHYSYENATQLLAKMNHYSTLFAEQNQHLKQTHPIIAYLKKTFHFWNYFIIKKGFLYGYEGYLISYCNAQGAFFKYMKLYEMNQKEKA